MARNDHFRDADSVEAAAKLLGFTPTLPKQSAGRALKGMAVHVLDHKRREVPIGDRSLEIYFDGFTVCQHHSTAEEASRRALGLPYGPQPEDVMIGSNPGKMYQLGPEVPPDDIDGRQPAVVVWSEGALMTLIASSEMNASELLQIARSVGRG